MKKKGRVSFQEKRRENFGMAPYATVRGRGGKVLIFVAGHQRPANRILANILKFPSARKQTPPFVSGLYRIHTFIWYLDRLI
jgi:hypothetical protein